jgi:hypothetical protein
MSPITILELVRKSYHMLKLSRILRPSGLITMSRAIYLRIKKLKILRKKIYFFTSSLLKEGFLYWKNFILPSILNK